MPSARRPKADKPFLHELGGVSHIHAPGVMPAHFHAIERSPGESIYALAKMMNWSTGKTYAAARRLEKAGMIHIEKAARNGREVLVVKPKTWEEYFTTEELEEMRRPEFMDEVEAIVKSGR